MQAIAFYKAEPLLSQLPNESIRALAMRGRILRFKANFQIITQGQVGQDLFVVLDGKLEAYVHSSGRKERRLSLANLYAGDIFGEGAVDGGQRMASVCTVSSSLCAMVQAAVFRDQRTRDARLQD